jgi:DNA-binding transcriptional ArsR family regulator
MMSHDILLVGDNDILTPIETLSLTVLMTSMAALVFFMVRDYSKRVKAIRIEYQRARTVISEILVEINRRMEEVKSSLAQTKIELSETALKIRSLESETFNLMEMLQRKADDQTMVRRLAKIEERTDALEDRIEEVIGWIRLTTHKETIASKVSQRYTRSLNETMKKILKSLELGPKNYKEVQKITGLSREHVSRELKKLYELGFLHRDESKRPYVYMLVREAVIE